MEYGYCSKNNVAILVYIILGNMGILFVGVPLGLAFHSREHAVDSVQKFSEDRVRHHMKAMPAPRPIGTRNNDLTIQYILDYLKKLQKVYSLQTNLDDSKSNHHGNRY